MANQLEVAAVPAVVQILTAAKTAFATIFNGDPATAGLRAAGAVQVFLGQVNLAVIAGAGAEFSAAGAVVQSNLDALIAKAQSIAPTPATTPAASTVAAVK